jgi:hypothetical protein
MTPDSLHLLRDLCVSQVEHAFLHSTIDRISSNSSHERGLELKAQLRPTTEKVVDGVGHASRIVETGCSQLGWR